MPRAALFLSDHCARLHLRRASPSLLQSRTSKHRAASTIRFRRFFDSRQSSRAPLPTYDSQLFTSRIAPKDVQFLPARPPLHSSASSWIVLSLAGLLSGALFYALAPDDVGRSKAHGLLSYLHRTPDHQNTMATEIQPGRPETLTKDEEAKLRELWIATFKVCGVSIVDGDAKDGDNSSIKTETKDKKRKMSFFRRVAGAKDEDAEADGEEDKYGLAKIYNEALKSMTPQEIRDSIWEMVKIDNPDALLLRFLRARKWDVQKALVMMISTMKWRQKDMLVDQDIMKNGELVNLDEGDVISPAKKKLANDMMSQLVMGKSFLHGLDKEGRPMCFIRVRLHKPGAQSVESLERFTVYQIETTRLMMLPPVDTAVRALHCATLGEPR